jgi:hypothetical protein
VDDNWLVLAIIAAGLLEGIHTDSIDALQEDMTLMLPLA